MGFVHCCLSDLLTVFLVVCAGGQNREAMGMVMQNYRSTFVEEKVGQNSFCSDTMLQFLQEIQRM